MIYAIDSHVYMSFLKTSKAQQAGGYQTGPKVREKFSANGGAGCDADTGGAAAAAGGSSRSQLANHKTPEGVRRHSNVRLADHRGRR